MRSYNQFCSMARALDVVGDRWTLLIVRELLTAGDCRFSDLRRGLPGIASNLLSERLRDMEAAGVTERRDEPPPISATVIRLTDRGNDLRGIVRELTRWGAPLMFAPQGDAEFRMHWFALPLRYLCRDSTPEEAESTVRFGTLADGCDVVADHGAIAVERCTRQRLPDVVVDGPAHLLVELFTGFTSLERATTLGLTVDGDPSALTRLLPAPPEITPQEAS